MSDHALLAPSSADRWVNCPASVQHEARHPETEPHPTTIEGEAIHEVAAKVLQDFVEHGRKGHTYKRSDFIDTVATNGTVITSEMLDVAEEYVRDVIAVSGRFDGLAKVNVEYRVYMPNIHKENWGTLDASVVFADLQARTMVVSDLKCGWGIVEVIENWQLLDYSVGLINDCIERNHPLPGVIEFRLVQPRPYHRDGTIRVWKITLAELEPYVIKMRESAADAFSTTPTFRTGKHCAHCRGRSDCPALIQAGYNTVEVLRGVQPALLSGPALGKHLTMLREIEDLVKALSSSLEDKALIDIQNGKPVAGWEWSRTRGSVRFTGDKEQVFMLGDLYGVELRNVSLPTPKQAIAMGMPEDVINTVSTTIPGSIKLVPADTRYASSVFKPQE